MKNDTTKIQQCIDMYNSGMRPKDIAVKMGALRSTVNRYLYDARKSGRLEPAKVTQRRHKRIGLMRDVTTALPPDVMEWLYNQTPNGAWVAHTIAAIITDAYHEENEK